MCTYAIRSWSKGAAAKQRRDPCKTSSRSSSNEDEVTRKGTSPRGGRVLIWPPLCDSEGSLELSGPDFLISRIAAINHTLLGWFKVLSQENKELSVGKAALAGEEPEETGACPHDSVP